MGRPTEAVGKVMGKLKGARQAMTGGAGIFKTLAEQHGEVSAMIRRVAASTVDSRARIEMFPRIQRELLAHAKAEEAEVYPALRSVPGLADKIAHASDEHANVERMLNELAAMDYGDPRWIEKFHRLAIEVEKHVLEEEQEVFPIAKDAWSRAQAEEIDRRFRAAHAALHEARLFSGPPGEG